MKAMSNLHLKAITSLNWLFLVLLFLGSSSSFMFGQNAAYLEFKGQVTDAMSGKPIPEVQLSVENTNISAMANTSGEFNLKVPKEHEESVVRFSKINYDSKSVQLTFFDKDYTEITLEATTLKAEELDEVAVYRAIDPRVVVENFLRKQKPNSGKLVGFYREKIDRGRHNVMLGEAVVQIDRDKWSHGNKGEIAIYKSRKTTDYKRLDTLTVKLRGGPYSALYLDLANYPELLFPQFETDDFQFSFEEPTIINNRYIYVIYFEQVDKRSSWYYGTMYIDAKSSSLVKIDYNVNVDDRRAAEKMLVVNKPRRAKVTPLEINYLVEYIEKEDQWYYNYSRFFIDIRVNWKGKLFNSRYAIHTEMAITDRSPEAFFPKEKLTKIKPSVIMIDDISGFEDPEFWGANNTIHPDKNLQEILNAIKDKIKKEK